MSDDFGTSAPSSPASNGVAQGPASAVSVLSIRDTEETSGSKAEVSITADRFLVAEINRLAEEIRELKQFKDKYYEFKEKYYATERRLAVLKETLKSFRMHHFLSSVCLIAGSAGIATAPNFPSPGSYGWYLFVSVSVLLLIGGMVSRVDSSPRD